MYEAAKVAIVDDDFLIVEYLRAVCQGAGCEVVGVAGDGRAAMAMIEEARPTHVLLDYRLGAGPDGVDVSRYVRARGLDPTVIFITGSTEPETLNRLEAEAPYKVLIKPISPDELTGALRGAA
ncbi:MAG: response regulator [Phenylobacterium sp.]|uniref:response regulator n=1 Tax=Phenylobacterium sp. TaxID=1871053 RepID=UPI0025E24F52|nr:response regulator [Phenylobacterium sp.]MBI1198861.1 response regulator [Phenylobacterium sp.]